MNYDYTHVAIVFAATTYCERRRNERKYDRTNAINDTSDREENLSFPRKHRRATIVVISPTFLRKDGKKKKREKKKKKKMEKRSLQPPIGRVEMEFGRSVVGAAKSVEGSRIASIRGIVRVEAKKRPGVSA